MRLIYIFVLMLLPTLAFSQEEAFYIEFKDEALSDVIQRVEDTYNVLFSYKDEDITGKIITIPRKNRTLPEVLEALKLASELQYELVENRYVILNSSTDKLIDIQELDKVVVNSYLTKGIVKNNDGSFKLFPAKLGILPGITEPDVLESIQLLPGVLSPNENATGFFVRGGTSDQNRLIWDGINLYHKGHLFGMISPINPNVASSISFINKGTHARYGERLSSVIDIRSKSEIENDVRAEVGVNGINADALLSLPILKDKISIEMSARRSFVDLFETIAFTQFADKVFESTKIKNSDNSNNDFSFLDYNLKINYKPNSRNQLYASIISIDNQLDYDLFEDENNRVLTDKLTTSNIGYGLGWNINWNENIIQNTQLFFSDYKLDYSFITTENDDTISEFEKRNIIYDSGVSTEFNFNAADNQNLALGYQYTLKDVSYGFLSTSDLSFILDTEDRIVQTHSVYSSYTYKNNKWFDLDIGLRGTYFKELNAIRLEPRFLLQKDLFKNLKLQISGEIKNQIISEIDETLLSDLSLENRVWRLADGDEFPIINGQHVSAGFIYSNRGFSLDIDSYYKKLNNITALSLGFLNPENSNFNIGERNIFGVDVFMKKRLNRFNSWFSYSYNRSRSKFKGLNNNNEFRSKTNVTHAISTALSYKHKGLQLALGWKWQTGKPYTVAEGEGESLSFNDGINTGDLPIYHRLDFSSTYEFNFSNNGDVKAKVGVSIRNLYDRRNLISREYRGNNNFNDTVEQIDRYSIGITPNLLFRVYW